jgi:hypothetical protein
VENYKVTLLRPAGVSVAEMNEYIKEAITTMVGTYHADADLYGIREHSIKVAREHDHPYRKTAIF